MADSGFRAVRWQPLADGRIVRVDPAGGVDTVADTGGRPLGRRPTGGDGERMAGATAAFGRKMTFFFSERTVAPVAAAVMTRTR